MKYTLPKHGYARTSDYQGTTDDYTTDPDVANLKKSVSLHNAQVRKASRKHGRICGTLGRVRIKPRGPRNSSFYHTCIHEATHFDVYAGEDTEAMYQLGRELDTGLTPSQLRKLDKAKNVARTLETIGYMQKAGRDTSWLIETLKDM